MGKSKAGSSRKTAGAAKAAANAFKKGHGKETQIDAGRDEAPKKSARGRK